MNNPKRRMVRRYCWSHECIAPPPRKWLRSDLVFFGGNSGAGFSGAMIVEKDERKNIYEEIRICTEGDCAGMIRVGRGSGFNSLSFRVSSCLSYLDSVFFFTDTFLVGAIRRGRHSFQLGYVRMPYGRKTELCGTGKTG